MRVSFVTMWTASAAGGNSGAELIAASVKVITQGRRRQRRVDGVSTKRAAMRLTRTGVRSRARRATNMIAQCGNSKYRCGSPSDLVFASMSGKRGLIGTDGEPPPATLQRETHNLCPGIYTCAYMALKSAAFWALVGMCLVTTMLLMDFVKTVSAVVDNLMPAVTFLRSLVFLIGSLSVTAFFFVFHRAQR